MNNQKGFTLIETLIAIFILTLTIGALLQLAAGGFYSVRYARNQFVATTLLQESLEYMHNSRDTASINGVDWQTWLGGFAVNSNGTPVGGNTGCFSSNGCMVDPYDTAVRVKACGSTCQPIVFYTSSGLYGYRTSNYPAMNGQNLGSPSDTSYVRKITMTQGTSDQMTITATVSWKNGSATKSATQSILLTRWK